jgi:acyl-CoA reductase-like NAD-dependent aldehyde dehydrogenase
MCHEGQWAVVEEHLRDAVERGARVIVGGIPPEGSGRVIPPTVLTDVERGMKVLEEETFGPVLPVIRVRDEREAIDRANEGPFGLFASVWTRRRERGLRVARSLKAGGVSINDTLSHYALPDLPMGGVGGSGFGRTRGTPGLLEMTRTRSILEDRLGLHREPWWYPYSAMSLRLNRTLIELRGGGGWRAWVRAARALTGRGGEE